MHGWLCPDESPGGAPRGVDTAPPDGKFRSGDHVIDRL